MRCLIFMGLNACETIDVYNKWAQGKMLAKDVIIHSHVIAYDVTGVNTLVIVVFFDESRHPSWVGIA